MNLAVSFGLALWVAIRSTGRGAVSRRRLRRAVLAHLVWPPRAISCSRRAGGRLRAADATNRWRGPRNVA